MGKSATWIRQLAKRQRLSRPHPATQLAFQPVDDASRQFRARLLATQVSVGRCNVHPMRVADGLQPTLVTIPLPSMLTPVILDCYVGLRIRQIQKQTFATIIGPARQFQTIVDLWAWQSMLHERKPQKGFREGISVLAYQLQRTRTCLESIATPEACHPKKIRDS